jgi:hypothetical protein
MKKRAAKYVSYFLIIKSKAMNTNKKDPGTSTSAQEGGCCGGLGNWGCC